MVLRPPHGGGFDLIYCREAADLQNLGRNRLKIFTGSQIRMYHIRKRGAINVGGEIATVAGEKSRGDIHFAFREITCLSVYQLLRCFIAKAPRAIDAKHYARDIYRSIQNVDGDAS